LVISLVVLLAYLPTFTGEFILDDNPLIKNNRYIKERHSVYSYLAQEDGITDREDSKGYHTGYYRPLITFSYWLDYKLWGMTPQGFRATNVVLHLLTCCFLFKLILFLVNDRQAAFWATLLYAIHPVNTESVSWVAARNNIIVTLFFLLSFYCYVKRWEGGSPTYFIASVVFFALAVFSKEFGLLVLPCIFFYQRFLSGKKRNLSDEIISYLPFVIMGVGYFLFRNMVTGSWLTPSDAGDLWKKVYFAPYLVAWNLKLIFFPYHLHSFIINYPPDYLNYQTVAGFSCMTLLGLLTWKARRNKCVIFSICSFYVALLPILNIIPTSAVTLMSMRWLYLPMIFVSLAATQLIRRSVKKNRALTVSVLSLALVYFGTHSYILNKYLWHDEDTFFRREVWHFNNCFYAGGLAESLFNKKDYKEAERYFRVAISRYPKETENYINYSALLVETGRPEVAISLLERATSLSMTRKERGEWNNNMGTAYFHLKKHIQALKYFRKAITFFPDRSELQANLGATYGAMGDHMNAVSALRKGLNMTPDSVLLRKNLAVAYHRMGNCAKAISVIEEIPPQKREEQSIKEELNRIYMDCKSQRPPA
jgi:tetratricopeptide (TPR) repeat protein